MKQEILELEDMIPWTCVRRSWRNRRAAWRRQVKQVELVAGFASKLKELRQALLIEDTALIGCGPSWRNQLELCIQGRGSASQLALVWDEMKGTVRGWLFGPNFTQTKYDSMPVSAAFSAMQHTLRDYGSDILQVPLESMVHADTSRLLGIREAIEMERKKMVATLGSTTDVRTWPKMHNPFQESDFDSGAEMTDGDLTDVDPAYDML